MAIIKTCCCFGNVRSGSNGSAIFTLIYATIILALSAYQLVRLGGYNDFGMSTLILTCFNVALLALIVVASILVLVGISLDKRDYLLPYMILMPMVILIQIVECITYIVYLTRVISMKYVDGVAIVSLVISATVTVVDVMCFLCVVSQYQELRDGRGRIGDVIAARLRTRPNQYTPQQGSTAQEGYPLQPANPSQHGSPHQQQQQQQPPPTLQGYNPPQQGYATQQGYPQQQGYPPQQGYSPQPSYPSVEGYTPQPGNPLPPQVYPPQLYPSTPQDYPAQPVHPPQYEQPPPPYSEYVKE